MRQILNNQELNIKYKALGVDVDALESELQIYRHYRDLAEKNIKKKRGFLRNFFKEFFMIFPFSPLTIDSPRWNDKEIDEEYERLMDLEGNERLHKLRPDIYNKPEKYQQELQSEGGKNGSK